MFILIRGSMGIDSIESTSSGECHLIRTSVSVLSCFYHGCILKRKILFLLEGCFKQCFLCLVDCIEVLNFKKSYFCNFKLSQEDKVITVA